MKVQVEHGSLFIRRDVIHRWRAKGKVRPQDIHWTEPQELELEDGELTLSLAPSPLPSFVRVSLEDGSKLIVPGEEDA